MAASRPITPAAAARLLREALDQAAGPVCLCDARDRIVFANRAFVALNPGVERFVRPGRRYVEHLRAGLAIGNYPDKSADPEGYLAERLALRRRGGAFEIRRQNGRWLLVSDERVPGGGTLTICLDITERKHAEAQAALEADRLRMAADAARAYAWVWDVESDRLSWMAPPEPLLGPPPPGGAYPDFRDMVHPDDREGYLQVGRDAMAALSADRRTRDYVHEFRIVRTDGDTRWVLARGRAYGDASGRALRFAGVTVDTHERKLAEEQLAASEERFRHLTSLSSDWYWEQDEALRFTFISSEVGDKSGIDASVHLGKTRWDMPALSLGDEDWNRHRAGLARREPFRDFVMRRPDRGGRERWVSISGDPVFDAAGRFRGYRGVGKDITERVLLERSLRDAESRLRLILDSVPAAINYFDREESFGAVNRGYCELLERPREDIVGRTIREVVGGAVYAQAKPHIEAVLGGSPVRFERSQVLGDGSVRDLVVQYVPHHGADGRVHGAFSLLTDVTDLKAAQRALRDMNAALDQRVRERTAALEAALRELESFSSSVSHDLRAPLRAMSAFARMVVDEEEQRISAEGRRKLGVVEAGAVKMGLLIDDLLALARLTRTALARETVDVGALVASALEQLQPQYPETEAKVGTLPAASADATLLRQAFLNLIDNAMKYSSKSAAPRVEIDWDGEKQAYYVRDNGVGFDMRFAGKLFGTFERLHAETEFPGTGIGLAIVRRVVERHGGRAWAESAPAAGATFYFTLPS